MNGYVRSMAFNAVMLGLCVTFLHMVFGEYKVPQDLGKAHLMP